MSLSNASSTLNVVLVMTNWLYKLEGGERGRGKVKETVVYTKIFILHCVRTYRYETSHESQVRITTRRHMTFGGARNGLWQNVENGETSASRSLFPDADGISNMMPYRKMTIVAASLEVKAPIIERQLSI